MIIYQDIFPNSVTCIPQVQVFSLTFFFKEYFVLLVTFHNMTVYTVNN
jgi:hypothetical protein